MKHYCQHCNVILLKDERYICNDCVELAREVSQLRFENTTTRDVKRNLTRSIKERQGVHKGLWWIIGFLVACLLALVVIFKLATAMEGAGGGR